MSWRAVAASPLGFLIGVSLGALGGGGSILAVPALVYGAGQSASAATTTSLVLVGVTSLIGLVPHWRAGRVRVLPGIVFGLAGVGGSLLGSAWNRAVDPDVLLLGFSGLMLVAAAAMWRRTRSPERPTPATPTVAASTPGAPDGLTDERGPGGMAATLVLTPPSTTGTGPSPATRISLEPAVVAKVAVAGTVVGLLTGFFGVGGGFVIVPALVLALGFTMPEAVGTSLIVIAINSAVALASRLDGGSVDWAVIVPFMATSLVGLRVGTRLAGTVDPRVLQRWFVGLLLAVALYTATRSLLTVL